MVDAAYILNKILEWSEVWALLIPLFVLSKYKKQPGFLKPVIIYLLLALLLDTAADIIMEINSYYKQQHKSPPYSNNFLYNIHSITRFICFSSFFILLRQPFLVKAKKYLPILSAVLVVINFAFYENFFDRNHISSRLFATEAGLLLFYCLQYYLFKLQEDKSGPRQADFWIVTGLSIYVVFNFPFFLLYTTLLGKNGNLLVNLWNYHNITYIIFCIFIAKAFYVARNK